MDEIPVLIVEDSIYSADLNIRELKKAGFAVRHQVVSSGAAMQNALDKGDWELIISDNSIPNFSALKALEIRNCADKNVPFIIVSEDICRRDIDKAFQEGCSAYVSKENLSELRKIASEVLKEKRDGNVSTKVNEFKIKIMKGHNINLYDLIGEIVESYEKGEIDCREYIQLYEAFSFKKQMVKSNE